MGIAELSYELHETVRFIVGAQGFEPGTVWPYQNILEYLNANPLVTPDKITSTIVDKYINHYSAFVTGVSVHQAACDLGRLGFEKFVHAVKLVAAVLFDEMSKPKVKDAITLARLNAQSFNDNQYVDLWHFCDLLGSRCDNDRVQSICDEVKKAIDGLARSRHSGPAFQHSHGVSVFFPWKVSGEVLAEYRRLRFALGTRWDEFIDGFVHLSTVLPISLPSMMEPRRIEIEGHAGKPMNEMREGNLRDEEMNQVSGKAISQPSRLLRVFLCHSSGDKAAVRQLYKRLRDDGFEPWLDEVSILPGQRWQDEIERAVQECEIVLVCLSRGSVNKAGYVQKEIKFALDKADEKPEGHIYIIPLRLEECDVPKRLQPWQWVSLFEDQGYQKLLLTLNKRARAISG